MSNSSFVFGTVFGSAFICAAGASGNLTAYNWSWQGYALLAVSAMLIDFVATYRANKKKVK